MANTRVKLLFVLTLLQLCRAEISNNDKGDNLPQWFSANVINDGFQPKSISEIFSTESPFSSTNPIVVLPKLTAPNKILSSTLPPPNSVSGDFTKTIIPLSSTTSSPSSISTIPPQLPTDFSSRFPSQTPQVEITQFTEQSQPPSQSFFETQSELQQTTRLIPSPTFNQQITLRQDPPPAGRFIVPLRNDPELPTTQLQSTSSTPGSIPDYFVVYQKAPQNPQGFPAPGSLQGGIFGLPVSQQSSTTIPTGSTVFIQPTPTTTLLTSRIPSTFSTQLPITSSLSTFETLVTREPTTRRPTTDGLSTGRPTIGGSIRNCTNGTQYSASAGSLPVRIRIVGPRGSITHVNINPPKAKTTTTTTRRPRTRKTPKPKKNSYEGCLAGCKARRDPVCAIPLSATSIDPEKLKGFPSVCHMACFNSYKKEPYEKLLDGRCGRLRTRIQAFDSKTKLTREELNKTQYVIDGGDQTIVEFSGFKRHK